MYIKHGSTHSHIYEHTVRKERERSSVSDLFGNVISQSEFFRGKKGHELHPTGSKQTDW